MKKYNFNAGPSILPREVIENTAKQCLDFNGSGLSLRLWLWLRSCCRFLRVTQ